MHTFSPLVSHERSQSMHRHSVLKMIENTVDDEQSYSLFGMSMQHFNKEILC